MDREEAFEFLDRTARGIAEMFGSTCETLVHDMGDPSHPILSIYNGPSLSLVFFYSTQGVILLRLAGCKPRSGSGRRQRPVVMVRSGIRP